MAEQQQQKKVKMVNVHPHSTPECLVHCRCMSVCPSLAQNSTLLIPLLPTADKLFQCVNVLNFHTCKTCDMSHFTLPFKNHVKEGSHCSFYFCSHDFLKCLSSRTGWVFLTRSQTTTFSVIIGTSVRCWTTNYIWLNRNFPCVPNFTYDGFKK